jgi:hypothetical protein
MKLYATNAQETKQPREGEAVQVAFDRYRTYVDLRGRPLL